MFKFVIVFVPAVLLACILYLNGLQAQRETAAKPQLEQVVNTIITSSVDEVLARVDPEYSNATNKVDNENWLIELKQDLEGLGSVVSIAGPVYSYRAATRPIKSDSQSDVYIVPVRFTKGEVLFRIGLLPGTLPDNAASDSYRVDRLYVSSDKLLDKSGKQKRYSLTVKCDKSKKIRKNCSGNG